MQIKSLLISLALVATANAEAREFTLVEKDSFGEKNYYSGVVANDLVFVNSSSNSVPTFDLSNPSSLERKENLAFNCGFDVFDIAKDGNIVAVHCGFGIEFFDVSDPDNIQSVGTYDSTSYAINAIILEGTRLFMLGGNSDLLVFDATDLNNITELGRVNIGNISLGDVKKQGDYLYVVNEYNSLDIYNVADPENILTLGSHPAVGTAFYSVEVIGTRAYIGKGSGLQVVDISDPNSPTLITNVNYDDDFGSLNSFRSMAYDGNHFIAASFSENFYSIDLTTPDSPVVTSLDVESESSISGIKLDGDTLVVFNEAEGLRTYDISDLSSIASLDQYTRSMDPEGVSLSGNKAIVADGGDIHHIFELDAELNLSEVDRIYGYNNSYDANLEGNIAHIARGNDLYTLNISTAGAPVILDTDAISAEMGAIAWNIEKFENQLIVSTNQAALTGFNILEIGLEQAFTVDLGVEPNAGSYRLAHGVVKRENYLYVTTQFEDLTVIDISNPASPSIEGRFNWSSYEGNDRDIAIFGDRAFLARNIGLMVVDIANPTSPQFVSTLSTFGLTDSIEKIDDTYAIVTSSSGVFLADFSDPTNPMIAQELDVNYRVGSVAIDGSNVILGELFGVQIHSLELNQAPQAQSSSESTAEDTPITAALNITDRENDSLTISLVTSPENGSVEFDTDGNFTYIPAANFNGNDSFTYVAQDAYEGESEEATVTLSITAVNDAPVIETLEFSLNEDSTLSGSLTASDVENDSVTFELQGNASNGTLELNSDGSFTYVPTANFFGVDTFSVVANDGTDDSVETVISIAVLAVNDAPVISVEDFSVEEDGEYSSTASASDIENDDVTFSLGSNAANGNVTVNPDGSFTYVANTNFNGSDSFTLIANDGADDSDTATVNVTVTPVNDAPTAAASSASVVSGEQVTGTLQGADIDGDTLTYSLQQAATNGTVTVNSNGQYTYTSNEGFTGNDSFSYVVTDESGETATATVSINVTAKPKSGGALYWMAGLILLMRRKRNSN